MCTNILRGQIRIGLIDSDGLYISSKGPRYLTKQNASWGVTIIACKQTLDG